MTASGNLADSSGAAFGTSLAQTATQYPNSSLDKAFSTSKSCKAIA